MPTEYIGLSFEDLDTKTANPQGFQARQKVTDNILYLCQKFPEMRGEQLRAMGADAIQRLVDIEAGSGKVQDSSQSVGVATPIYFDDLEQTRRVG